MPILILVLLYYRMRLMAWLFGFAGQSKAQRLERELEWTKHSFSQVSQEAAQLRQTVGRMSSQVGELERTKKMLMSVAEKRLESISELEKRVEELEAALNTSKLECEATDVLLLSDRDKLRVVQAELDDAIHGNQEIKQSYEAVMSEKQALQQQCDQLLAQRSASKPVKAKRNSKKKS